MDVGVEVGGKRAKSLDGAHRARPYVLPLEKLLETLTDALIGGLREKGEQGAFAFEKAAECLRDSEHIVTMRDRL
jgi:hypothetical protein